ncbi:hypothetical protein C0995_015693 [Termitomyces sp. Mi166|nr:hypothetical protein C0995_015693 [Termitomyces sp. Mi166\
MSSVMASISSSITATAAAATSSTATKTFSAGKNLKVVGIILAITSGCLIGSSFVFKKKGLLRSQAGGVAGEGVAYLKSLGSVIIALNGPSESAPGQIREFQKLFLSPGFIAWGSVLIVASIIIVIFFAPSMIGGISVSVTTGLGAAIVQTAMGDNQALTEVYYLNKALALFNTAMVTPTYYVIFTFFSMVTTIVLFRGLKSSADRIITLVMGFLVICVGIIILQMSKIDPKSLGKLDRRSTILLQAARSQTQSVEEKDALGVEDPGMDALRGSFGAVGSIIRARSARRMSQSSSRTANRRIRAVDSSAYDRDSSQPWSHASNTLDEHPSGLQRHQLYDAPMPISDINSTSSVHGSPIPGKRQMIKFDSQDIVHQYDRPGTGDTHVTEHRRAIGSPAPVGYPPLPQLPYPGLPPPSTTSTTDLLGHHEELEAIGEPSSVRASTGSSMKLGSPFGSPGKTESTGEQTLTMPASRFANDSEIRSAPPMSLQAGFPGARKNSGGIDSRGVFTHSHSASDGTLLSFPSVTDSARSEDWDEDASAGSKQGTHRGRPDKRYPKGAGDDDREESVSLWHKNGEGEVEDEEEGPSPLSPESGLGSIRLVTPRVGSRF